MPETEVVGSCAAAARSALIIGPTVYGGTVALQQKTRTPTTTTGTVTTITQNGRPDKSPPAFRPSRTRSSKSFIHPRGKVHSRGHVCRADWHCKRGIYALSATQLSQSSRFYAFPSDCINSICEDKNTEAERNCFNQ